MRLLAFLMVLGISCVLNTSVVQAEESVLLSDVLKPSAEQAGQSTTPNLTLIFFNTLLVLGLGILVMRQPWCVAWMNRVKVAHLEEQKPLLQALWQSVALPSTWHALEQNNLAKHYEVNPPHLMPSWLERVDVQELASGVKLYWVRLHGQDYLLTETANHTQWLKLGEQGSLLPQADAFTEEAEPILQRLPDYLDAM